MAQIGTFTRDENGAYAGTIKTLTLNVKAAIKPCDRGSSLCCFIPRSCSNACWSASAADMDKA